MPLPDPDLFQFLHLCLVAFSCLWWLWRAAHFSHCVETTTAQTGSFSGHTAIPPHPPPSLCLGAFTMETTLASLLHSRWPWALPIQHDREHAGWLSVCCAHVYCLFGLWPDSKICFCRGIFPHPYHLPLRSVKHILHSPTVTHLCFHIGPEMRSGQSQVLSTLYSHLVSFGHLMSCFVSGLECSSGGGHPHRLCQGLHVVVAGG